LFYLEGDIGIGEELAGKYLTFNLSQETYGIEIIKVQEIIGMMNVTKFPKTPDFIRGVINLRGKVIPVIDIRKKFSLEDLEDTEKTCIIVVQVEMENEVFCEGIIVDEVSEVVDIEGANIELPPSFELEEEREFIKGIGKIEEKVIILLDVSKIISGLEV
jgi:purine-binding chemotaxis protein CheW